MPEMDGPETVQRIRELYAQAEKPQPFIACVTAYTQESIRQVALGSGMDEFYTKPI